MDLNAIEALDRLRDGPVIQLSPAAQQELWLRLGAAPGSTAEADGAGSKAFQAIDRLRDGMAALQARLDAQPVGAMSADVGLHRPARAAEAVRDDPVRSGSAVTALEQAMHESLRIQTEIFKLAIGFHAGLTASQQSQSGVKSLIEKS